MDRPRLVVRLPARRPVRVPRPLPEDGTDVQRAGGPGAGGPVRRVAEAFWGLLLAKPHDLPEYRDRMLHIGAGVWLVFGVEAGRPFIEEHEEEPGEE